MPTDTLTAAASERHDGSPTRRDAVDRGWWRRLVDLPLWAHAGLLLVVLVALMPLVGTGGLFSGDEGALAAQTRQLHEDGDWVVPHPFPEVDPEGTAFPYDLSQLTADGGAPFVKHPA